MEDRRWRRLRADRRPIAYPERHLHTRQTTFGISRFSSNRSSASIPIRRGIRKLRTLIATIDGWATTPGAMTIATGSSARGNTAALPAGLVLRTGGNSRVEVRIAFDSTIGTGA